MSFSGSNPGELSLLRNLLSNHTALSCEWPLLPGGGSGPVEIMLKYFLERSICSHNFTASIDSMDDYRCSSQFRTILYALKCQSEDVVLGTTHA